MPDVLIAARVVLVVLAAVCAAGAVLAGAVSQSLGPTGAAAFTAGMNAAIQEPDVRAEVQQAVTRQIDETAERLAASVGPFGDLARGGGTAISQRVAGWISGPSFPGAWDQWTRLLYTGLAATAQGQPADGVTVTGEQLTVAVAPLVTPVVGDTWANGLAGVLGDPTVTLDTGVDLQRVLTAAGSLAQRTTLLAVLAVGAAVAAAVIGPGRLAWAGAALLAAAGVCLVGVAAMAAITSAVPAGASLPLLTGQILATLVSPWSDALALAAGLFLVGGGILVGLALVVRGRAPRPQPELR